MSLNQSARTNRGNVSNAQERRAESVRRSRLDDLATLLIESISDIINTTRD